MSDPFKDWPPGYKPSDKEIQERARAEHEAKNQARKEGARGYEKELKKEGPGERFLGQDRHINQQESKKLEQSKKREELSPAQQETRKLREAAREEARKQMDIKHDDKKYPRLEPKNPGDRSR